MNTRQVGNKSEDLALNYLKNLGYKYITRNFFTTNGEIDLIFKDEEFIVFVEVKSIRENSDFSIYETLTKKKKSRVKSAINSWLIKNNRMEDFWRFDFLGIVKETNGMVNVEHFKFVEL